jgi:hypothetical protein
LCAPRITREQANRLLAETAGASGESREEAEYRHMFETFYQQEDILHDVRVMLIERNFFIKLKKKQKRG